MKKYLLCVIVTILFVACDSTNDLGTPFTKGQEVTLTAVIGEQQPQMLPGMQRVSGKDSGTEINLKWDEGDQIKVIVGDKSAIFTLTSGAGSSDGTFTGIMPADGNSFRVEYPIAEPDISTQTYIKDGFSNGLMKMVAENGTINGGFILKAQYALLGLQLMGNQTLSKIVVTNPTDKKTYTLHCSNVVLSNSPTLFYIVVPAGEWNDGFKVDIYDSNNTNQKTLTKSSTALFSTTQAMIMPVQGLDMIFNVNGVTFKMIYVEGGTFMMGAMEGDQSALENEKPAHKVTLTYDYYIGQTEVTQALWKAVMNNNPSTMEGDNLPVNNVLWEDADAFTQQLSQLTGYTFSLPTEAEWEYAARGGKESKRYLYAGSDDVNEVARRYICMALSQLRTTQDSIRWVRATTPAGILPVSVSASISTQQELSSILPTLGMTSATLRSSSTTSRLRLRRTVLTPASLRSISTLSAEEHSSRIRLTQLSRT